MRPKWVLASASPRRKQLLRKLRIPFQVVPSRVPEARRRGESPAQVVRRLAISKARHISERLREKKEPYLVLGADTVVVLNGKILGKPKSVRHAAWMLSRLSNRMHRVYTGVALAHSKTGRVQSGLSVSQVHLRSISKRETRKIGAKHLDKSGSYACQDPEDRLVRKIDGDWQGVMGLPIALVRKLAKGALSGRAR